MFYLENHKYLQQQWRLQKNFKIQNSGKLLIITDTFYKKLNLIKKVSVIITKIFLLNKFNIKIECFKYCILKINKKKLSIRVKELTDNFTMLFNIKASNIFIT